MLNITHIPIVFVLHNDTDKNTTASNLPLIQQSCPTTQLTSLRISAALSRDVYLTLCRIFRLTFTKVKHEIPENFCLNIKGKLKISADLSPLFTLVTLFGRLHHEKLFMPHR